MAIHSQDEARKLNENIFETIYFAACEASCELAELQGPYETFAGASCQVIPPELVILGL